VKKINLTKHGKSEQKKHSSSKMLPQTEINRLIGLFNSGHFAELETQARLLLKTYANSGFIWKVLGVALQVQGHDALSALQEAAKFSPTDAEVHSNLGLALRTHHQFEKAVLSFRQAIKIKPAFAEAHSNLGLCLADLGQFENAAKSYRHALTIQPDNSDTHIKLANSLKCLGQLDASVTSYLNALAIHPGVAELQNDLGLILLDLGQIDNAVARFRLALEIKPDFVEALNNLGNTYSDHKEIELGIECYRRALQLKPDFSDVHNNLGTALMDQGKIEDAIVSYRRALDIRPDYAEAYSNLGNALTKLRRLDEAIQNFRLALKLTPAYAEVHNNLANALTDLGQQQEAQASYIRALEINPNLFAAHSNLGNLEKDLGHLSLAIACYQRALDIKPDYAEAHFNLGLALNDDGQSDAAIASYRRALAIKPDFAQARSALLFVHNYLADQSAAKLFDAARLFDELVTKQARPYSTWKIPAEPGRVLRVGLVSADLRNHPVGYFIESILTTLAANDNSQIEIYVYYNHFLNDPLTEKINACCQNWHSALGLSDEDLARRIHDDGIAILIDLSGHTDKNRLSMFAWKPAPVQVSWLGYFATTGMASMDYLIADPWTAPNTADTYFTETIYRLPESYLCFTAPNLDLQVTSLPALANGYITFACFNNLKKMNDAVVALWARVLSAVPGSRLFLKTKLLDSDQARQNVIHRFANHGIDAERLILEGAAPRAELLAAYHRVDIALDPFPYPGGTTSVEALWMGVPVISLTGETFLSRIGESILQNARLPDWIAADENAYVAVATRHANDLQRLSSLRKNLRQQVLDSALFDAPRFALYFEKALRDMWVNWCAQQSGKQL
jgi:protein O-GlcNAc transferase